MIPSSYTSDDVWNYELGARNTLFGGHLQLDTSVFDVGVPGPRAVRTVRGIEPELADAIAYAYHAAQLLQKAAKQSIELAA